MALVRYRVWYDRTAPDDHLPWLIQKEGSDEPVRVQEIFFRRCTLLTSFIPEGHQLKGGPRGVMIVEVDE